MPDIWKFRSEGDVKKFRIQNSEFGILWKPVAAFLLSCFLSSGAYAAWAAAGGTCSAGVKAAGTSLACTVTTTNYSAGNVVFLVFGGDNTATVDGNDGLLTSVTDSQSNVWTVDRCFTNAQTGAATGATTCIAHSKLTTTLVAGTDTITANFSSITAKGFVTKQFTIGAGNVVSIVGTPGDLANDGADPGSITVGSLPSAEHLWVRATALERATGGTWTVTAGFTTCGCGGTTGNPAASNMDACGEFIIATATTESSDPTDTAVDNASTFIAFDEAAPSARSRVIVSSAMRTKVPRRAM